MSFSSASAIKTVLRRFSFITSRPKTESCRRPISVIISPEPEHVDVATSASDYETSSDSTYDSDSVMGMDTTATDTPLSWCCRGEIDPDLSSEDYKPNASGLLDSHVYVFNLPDSDSDSDLDFFCMGDEQWVPSERKSFSSRNAKSSPPRRWSAPHFLQSVAAQFSRKSELPTSPLSGCEETTEDHVWSSEVADAAPLPKKKPTHLNIEVPATSMAIKMRRGGIAMQCVSNKWGNHPPAGYI